MFDDLDSLEDDYVEDYTPLDVRSSPHGPWVRHERV
jgi:hypothetical protein